MPRFVVLYHETPEGYPRPSHWDLMLEDGERLRTWALTEAPRCAATIAATVLPDHRLEYLEYEGPLSQNRGSVRRWDWGEYLLGQHAPRFSKLRLNGNRIVADVTIIGNSQDQRCAVSFSAKSDS